MSSSSFKCESLLNNFVSLFTSLEKYLEGLNICKTLAIHSPLLRHRKLSTVAVAMKWFQGAQVKDSRSTRTTKSVTCHLFYT